MKTIIGFIVWLYLYLFGPRITMKDKFLYKLCYSNSKFDRHIIKVIFVSDLEYLSFVESTKYTLSQYREAVKHYNKLKGESK